MTSTLNSSNIQTLETPSSHSHSKTIRQPKPLRPKLQRILEAQISAAVGSETQYSEGVKNCNNNLRYLFARFESYYNIVHDGNQIFRIVGIHHIGSIVNKTSIIEEFCNNFLQSNIEANILTDVSPEYKRHCNKHKIVEILKALLIGLEKKKLEAGFYKNIATLLNNYKIFDFAIVAFYRLYTYMFGFLNSQLIDDLRFQQDLILGYGKQVDSDTINIICQCFSLKVDNYYVSGSIVELTCYEAKETKQTTAYKQANNLTNIYFSILKCNNHYALVEEKPADKLKEDEQILAGWRQDLTISEIVKKKNTQSQYNMTDQKSLWDVYEIEGPISPVQAEGRPRRHTQKIVRLDEMSSSCLNQFGIKFDPKKDKQQQQKGKRIETQSYIKPKQYNNMKISSVLSERVSPLRMFPNMKNQISEQDIDIMTSRKDEESLAGNKSSSRISSKAGTIKKQNISHQSIVSSQSKAYLNEDQRHIEIIYNQLSQSQKKHIVTEFLRSRVYERSQNHYHSPRRSHLKQSTMVNSKSLIISADGLEIQITKN